MLLQYQKTESDHAVDTLDGQKRRAIPLWSESIHKNT
jgi:hypothetical protein